MTGQPRLRVVHIVPRDGLGGVETAARSMAARNDLSCDFRLLFIAGTTLLPDNARIEAPGPGSTANPLAQLALLRRCLALRPDVVVVSLWRTVPLLVALRLLRPSIRLAMTVNSGRGAHWVDALMFRIGSAVADEMWSDSRSALVARGVIAPNRIISFVAYRLVPKSVSARPRPRFVSWARIDANKRFDVAIDLIARLAAHGVDARFTLFGPDGGELAALKRQAESLGIADRIAFPGPIEHDRLTEAAAEADFFLLASRSEGMAMACVEAMQLGLVTVVTPAGEMASYVAPGVSGLLIDPDKLDETATAIAALIADPPRYAAMRQRAIEGWHDAPLYADDMCAAASALAKTPRRAMTGRR